MQSGCNSGPIGPIFPDLLILLISLSVLGLFAGAGLVALGRLRLGATSALEGLALGMLPALVLLRLLPHAYESLGPFALALAAVGFGAVSLSHHAGERAEARLGGALVLPALLLHAVTDGAALAMSNTGRVGDSAGFLALAAILHRIPEGFFIASRQRAHGARAALLAAAPLAIATIAGAFLGQRIFDVLPDSALDGVLALRAAAAGCTRDRRRCALVRRVYRGGGTRSGRRAAERAAARISGRALTLAAVHRELARALDRSAPVQRAARAEPSGRERARLGLRPTNAAGRARD
jgi:zinc transporter ZupT